MARLNINNIENIEGKYHLMFFEGKTLVEEAKNDLRHALFSMMFFAGLVLLFIVFSGFNLFYIGFLVIFFILFLVVVIYLSRLKAKGRKQCIYAVQNSKTTDIIAKQVDCRGSSKALVNSMSGTLDEYDVQKKYPHLRQKLKRKKKHNKFVSVIMQFDKEEKNKGE